MITAIASAFLAAAIGMKYSIATFMTNGSIRTRRAISAVSRLTDRNGTVCRPLRESRCRQTVYWCSRATGEISDSGALRLSSINRLDARSGGGQCLSPTQADADDGAADVGKRHH